MGSFSLRMTLCRSLLAASRHTAVVKGRLADFVRKLTLSHVKDFASVVQATATVIALIAAAVWFFRQEQSISRANIAHSVQSLVLNDEWRWVRLTLTFSNVGQVPVNVSRGRAYIQRVLPLDPIIQSSLTRQVSPVAEETRTVLWPMIGEPYAFEVNAIVAPQEAESYNFDFIVPRSICVVSLYTYLEKDRHGAIGWAHSSLSNLEGCTNEK